MIGEEGGEVLSQIKNKIKIGKIKLKVLKIDKTLNWKIAEVTKVENEFSEIKY